ncbi:MAG: hypothetical protein D6737_18950 [Chloroflexi bacterium]|nr:MAG: hypothetical protein D6737_18950 [Chloroflexota bacterium]
MRKILSLLLGITIGGVIGAVLIAIFAPETGEKIMTRLRAAWQETLEEARQANEARRRELEQQLAAKRGITPENPQQQ